MKTAEQLTGLIEEIGGLRDSVEELYILLDHAWRNRQEIYDLLETRGAEAVPEMVSCVTCDAKLESLAGAVRAGWSQLQPEGEAFLGTCPDCLSKQTGAIQEETREQMMFCCQKPDLRWTGNPDWPGVACSSCGFVVAQNASLVEYSLEEVQEMSRKAKERQKSLFDA